MLTPKDPARPDRVGASSSNGAGFQNSQTVTATGVLPDGRAQVAAEKRFHALFDAAPLAICITRAGVAIYANQALADLLGLPDTAPLLGSNLQEFLDPTERDALVQQLQSRVAQGFYSQPTRYELNLCRSDGTRVPVRAEICPIGFLDGEATLTFAIDLSQERTSHSEIRSLLEREQRAGRFARELQSLSQSLSLAAFPDDVAEVGVESCLQAAGAFGGVFVVPHEGQTGETVLRLLHAHGYSAEAVAGWNIMTLDIETPITQSFRSGESMWVEDIEDPSQVERFPVLAGAAERTGPGALVALPMRLDDRVLGVLGLSFDAPREFDTKERIFLETLAASCAQALERARLDIERHEMVQRQRESLALLNTLLDSAPVGFALFDRDHRFVLVNEELARINSLSIEAHIGVRPLELLPAFGQRVEEALEHVWETGLPSGEIAFSQGEIEDGEEFRYCLMSLYPVRVSSTGDKMGEMIGVGAILHEQTERVRSEIERSRLFTQLETERARFEAILQQMPSAVVIAEAPSGRLILGNEQVSRIWKYAMTKTDSIADYTSHYRGFHSDGRELRPEEWPLSRAILKGEIVRDEEIPIERGDGERGTIRINAAPIRDSDQQITAAIAVFDDVTTRARANTSQLFLAEVGSILVGELGEKESLEAVAKLCALRVTDWCLFFLNQGGSSLSVVAFEGPTENQVAPIRDVKNLLERYQTAITEVAQVLKTGRGVISSSLHLENQTAPAELQTRLEQMNVKQALISPMVARGRTLGAMIWFNSQPKRSFDQENLNLAEELARRVALSADSARLLQEAQLARDEAQAANRAKDEFLAVVSHELRTPLTPILGWLELLRSPALGDELREQAYNVIQRNAVLQAQLVNDILDVSRITAGKLRLELKDVALDDIVAQNIESQRSALQEKNLQLQTDIESFIPVRADAIRLGQVVSNLLQNAIKFTPENGEITVSLHRASNTTIGSVARLEVSDTGTGIEAELLPHIFERFRQGDSSPTRKAGGLGLGLAIVKHIVESHGGFIQATSQGSGQGTTFVIEFPLLKISTRDKGRPPANARLRGGRLQGIKILIAEDEPDTREILGRLLEEVGAIVRVASNGRTALEITAQFGPDIIVSDVGMPEMDGLELRRELLARGLHMPAIALTAYTSSTDQAAAQAAGFERYLAKPVGAQKLVEILAQLLALP